MIKNIIKSTALVSLLIGAVHAGEIEVKIVNNTGFNTFTPLLIATHTAEAKLFTANTQASLSLQKMAEGGDISGLKTDLEANGATIIENPAEGLLMAGKSTITTLTTDNTNQYLSVVAMILPTNDGFIALNNWKVPTEKGVYKVNLNAHDAGTEGNDEIINGGGAPDTAGIPADPSGNAGTGATGISNVSPEGFIHIHRGILGDMNTTAGKSDLDATKHRWLNPIATAIITVK